MKRVKKKGRKPGSMNNKTKPTPIDADSVYIISEAAERLRISEPTMRKICKKNEIEASRIAENKALRITGQAIIDYLQKRRMYNVD